MIKKLITIFLALVILLLSGCENSNENTNQNNSSTSNTGTIAKKELQLLYCANDTMNPYKTISKLNAELGLLIFDPLVKVDSDFETVFALAESIDNKGSSCTVKIKDAKFSDGSVLTCDDVIYSYNLATKSERFSSLFYNVSSVTAIDSKTLVFNLKDCDPYFTNLLTFPIIKTGSDKLKDKDNVELMPIGCGPFVFDQTGSSLVTNSNYYKKTDNIKKINLINAPDMESMAHYVEIGATDIYYADMNDDTIIRMSSKKKQVNLNNLIYIGINHNYSPLKSSALRFAISSAVSRKDIVTKAFYSNAVVANGFFHPVWNEVSGYQSIQEQQDKKICVENLSNIGYNKLNNDGFYENKNGKVLELTLLVNKESSTKLAAANLISEQFESAGIKLKVNAVSKKVYMDTLKNGNYQLYLGEVKLLPNMDIRNLVVQGGSAAYGINYSNSDADTDSQDDTDSFDLETSYLSVINGFYKGKNTIVDVVTALQSSMPIIPLAFRSSIVFYSNDIEDVYSPSCYDIFISVDKYKIN